MTDLNLRSDHEEIASILTRVGNLAWRRWAHDKSEDMAAHFWAIFQEIDAAAEGFAAELGGQEVTGPEHVLQ